MCLDVIKVGGRFEGIILPIQPTEPTEDRDGSVSRWNTGTPWRDDLPMNVRISVTNGSDVALKVADIDRIKPYLGDTRRLATHWPEVFSRTSADDGHVESDICLSQTIADEISLVLQHGLNTVKRVEER